MIGRVAGWPDEVQVAMSGTRQGNLVSLPPAFFAADSRHPVHELSVPEEGQDPTDDELVEFESRPPYGLITTQSCDLDKRSHAWLHIAPVYQLDQRDKSLVRSVDQGRAHHLVKVTSPDLPEGYWVADLRLEVPVDKGWFVKRPTVAGFATEREFDSLARQMGGRRARPALSDELDEVVRKPLARWIEEDASRYEGVAEVRVSARPSVDKARDAFLTILTESDPLPEELMERWDAWWEEASREAAAVGLNLMKTRYSTLTTLSARDYIESAQLDLEPPM